MPGRPRDLPARVFARRAGQAARGTTRLLVQLTLVMLLLASHAAASVVRGQVMHVDDGDSVRLRDAAGLQHKVRLDAIDAPEHCQDFGGLARQHLSTLLLHRHVILDWQKQDRYGRLVGKLTVAGRDAGLAQLRAGLAWHYVAYASEQSGQDRRRYRAAERSARKKHIGLWQQAAPKPPWEFRRQCPREADGYTPACCAR